MQPSSMAEPDVASLRTPWGDTLPVRTDGGTDRRDPLTWQSVGDASDWYAEAQVHHGVSLSDIAAVEYEPAHVLAFGIKDSARGISTATAARLTELGIPYRERSRELNKPWVTGPEVKA